MAQWDRELPESLMERIEGTLKGDKPEALKGGDEYGRTPFQAEAPADTNKRLKEVE